jgi:hypothetical protein
MKKIIMTCIIALAAACLSGGCSSWRETTLRITEQQLQERLNEKFPIVKTHQLLGTVTYENPRISLQREDNRVELGLDISLSNIEINGKDLRGTVEMLASVTYNAKKKALCLTEPQLQQFILNGVPEQNVQLLSGLFMPAIEKLLKRKPLYRLKDQEGFKNIAAMLVKDIRVRDGCLEVVFGV